MRGSLRTRILIFVGLSVVAVVVPNFLSQTREQERANARVEQEALERTLDFKLETLRGHLSSFQFTLGLLGSELQRTGSQSLLANATNAFLTKTTPELGNLDRLVKRQADLNRQILGSYSGNQFTQIARLQSTFRQIGPIADGFLESFGTDAEASEELELVAQLLQIYRTNLFDLAESLKRDSRNMREMLDEVSWSHRFIEGGIYLAWLGGLGLLVAVLRVTRQFKEDRYLTALFQGHLPSEFEPLRVHLQKLVQRQTELARRLEFAEGEFQRSSNITRRIENDLSLERLFVRNLLNNLRAAVFVTDHIGRVDFTNRRAKELGQSSGSETDNNLWVALTQTLGAGRSIIDQIALDRRPFHTSSLRVSVSDAEYVFELTVSPHISPTGDILQFIWLLDDITEEVDAKNQLLQSEHLAAMGRISTQVAHEIRNPLSAINLNAELIQAELADLIQESPGLSKLGHAEESLSAMIREIERLENVTETYLQLSRMPQPNARLTNMFPILADLVQMYEPEWLARSITTELKTEGRSLPVLLDEGLFRQAMINILKNAAEAMPDGGRVEIYARHQGESTVVDIVDEGEGCSEEDMRRAFEPFFTTKAQGTGLGLHLTNQIVQDHGGSLTFEKNPRKGMTMRMSFPHRLGGA